MKASVSDRRRLFPTTDWDAVKGVGQADPDRALQALESVLQRYISAREIGAGAPDGVPERDRRGMLSAK